MNIVIVDTNILFSMFRFGSEKARDTILFNEGINFYAPNYIAIELFEHRERILKSGDPRERDLLNLMNRILAKIHLVNEDLVSTENIIAAFRLCKDIDENDTPFVALALELDASIWTNDKKLKIGLLKKGFDRFFEP